MSKFSDRRPRDRHFPTRPPPGAAGREPHRRNPREEGEPQHERREPRASHAHSLRPVHATHCQSVHWTTATPSSSALQATIAVCTRGRPPITASARKNGKTTRPNRGKESSGQRELG